jgi:hypothetical protein
VAQIAGIFSKQLLGWCKGGKIKKKKKPPTFDEMQIRGIVNIAPHPLVLLAKLCLSKPVLVS